MDIWEIVLMSLSLSIDSLVVSMSGSVTLGKVRVSKVLYVSMVFALIQAGLLFFGWMLGYSVASLVHKVAHIIGFVILLYIGGSMVWGALKKGDEEKVDLSGIVHLLLAGVATSIDAFAVGVSLAMSDVKLNDMGILTLCVAVVTMLLSALGISCGCLLGNKFGAPAKAVGGIALIVIGINLLCGSI